MAETVKRPIRARRDKALVIAFYCFTALFALFCLYPFLQIVISSFSDENTLIRYGYTLFPKKMSLAAYKVIFATPEIPRAYGVTVLITIAGTALNLLVTALAAYAVSGGKLKYRNVFNFFFYFTCLFSGGLVTLYILITNYLKLSDSLLVYIIPSMFNVWNMFLLRNFFNEIPPALLESAELDGAGYLTIFAKVIFPLCKPIVAYVAVTSAVGQWMSFQDNLLLMTKPSLNTLEFMLYSYLNQAASLAAIIQKNAGGLMLASQQATQLMPASVQMTVTVIVTLPILFVYPFFQRYFVAGIMIGAVKG